MNAVVKPGKLAGTVPAPSSKSVLQRLIALASLTEGETRIAGMNLCQDVLAALDIVRAFGVETEEGDVWILRAMAPPEGGTLNCREAGLSLRMFSPIGAVFPGQWVITGKDALKARPADMIYDALRALDIEVSPLEEEGRLPFSLIGPMKGGDITIDGSTTSQLLTGLLMALPLTNKGSHLRVENLKSRPYIDITLEILKSFGVYMENRDYEEFIIPGNQKPKAPLEPVKAEGDWSAGAFLLIASLLAGPFGVSGLSLVSPQGDKAVLSALEEAGAVLDWQGETLYARNPGSLKAFSFDVTQCPDLFPPLAALAAGSKGISRIKGVHRLKAKETDRAAALLETLNGLGIKAETQGDEMLITGGKPKSGTANGYNDHRMAMTGALLGLIAQGPVTVTGAACVDKSYPDFFKDMKKLGADIAYE